MEYGIDECNEIFMYCSLQHVSYNFKLEWSGWRVCVDFVCYLFLEKENNSNSDNRI